MIAGQANAYSHHVLIRRGTDRRGRVPQRNQFSPQRFEFVLRQSRGIAGRHPQRRGVAQRRGGRHLPLRLAVIEQGRDLIGVELGLRARLLGVVLFQLFGDLIGLEFWQLLWRLLGLVFFQFFDDLIGFGFRLLRLFRLLHRLGLGFLRLLRLLHPLRLGFDLGLWLRLWRRRRGGGVGSDLRLVDDLWRQLFHRL